MNNIAEIIRFRYAGLWNSEYPLVVNRVITIVGAHDPDELHLKRRFDNLVAFQPKLAKIEVQEKFDLDSAQLSEFDQQRDTAYSVVHNVTKTMLRSPVPAISENARVVMSILKKHGCDITSANYTAETKRMYDLLADVESQPDVMAAIEALALQKLFGSMDEANSNFDQLFMERGLKIAEMEHVDIRGIRIDCDKALTALWDGIDYCVAEYPDLDYMPLINAVNTLHSYYKQQLAARATRRRAKKDVSKEEPIRPEEIM